MVKESIRRQYCTVLKLHIAGPDEKYLVAAAELGRELVKGQISTEEIAELHEEGLARLAKESPDMRLIQSVRHISEPLMELLMAYGLAFRERVEARKQAEQALKEYSERLEEMVDERTRELRAAQEKLICQEKLAVLGQLAAGMSHELRNPLGAISNAAYFLNMAVEEPDPEVKETLEILKKEVRTSKRIINSLLDFAFPKPPVPMKVNINEIVQEALAGILVPENVEIVSRLDETIPKLSVDPHQLEIVFGNLIINAIQAMPEGGRIVVRSEAPDEKWVEVAFTDTGAGIPAEDLKKIFEPLFTTKARGIGLGLAMAKMLVEIHGGTIGVESPSTALGTGELGKGSTFTVKIPIELKIVTIIN